MEYYNPLSWRPLQLTKRHRYRPLVAYYKAEIDELEIKVLNDLHAPLITWWNEVEVLYGFQTETSLPVAYFTSLTLQGADTEVLRTK